MKTLALIVLLVTPLAAVAFQDLPPEKLQELLHTFYQKKAPLKLHVFLNQPAYIAGDTVRFSATVVHADGLMPLFRSSILNLALIDQNRNVLGLSRIRLNTSYGTGQLVIPPATKPGDYLLVAYHDWMKDTTPELYYQRVMRIRGEKELVAAVENTPPVFFAEGGNLIERVSNKIVVYGAPRQTGMVSDGSGKEITSFSTGEWGYGFFYLKPEPGLVYQAEVSGNMFALPEAVKDGLNVLATLEDNGARLRTILQKGPGLGDSKVNVLIDQQSSIHYTAVVTFDQEHAVLHIPLKELASGIARLSVFSATGKLLAERLFFVNNVAPIVVDAQFDKQIFSTRQKGSLQIKISDGAKGLPSRLSVSIFKKSSDDRRAAKTMVSDFLLFSDIKNAGAFDPGFDLTDAASLKMIDNFLVAQTWERAPWHQVSAGQEAHTRYFNMRFTGKAEDEQGQALPDSTLITFLLQENATTFQTYVRDGRIDMALFLDFYGTEEVYYRVEHNGRILPNAKLTLDEDTFYSYRWPQTIAGNRADLYYAQRAQERTVNESFAVFNVKAAYKKSPPTMRLIEEEVFGADIEIDLDKYIVFPTMEETLREIIPMVQHRRARNESAVRIYFPDIDLLAREAPLYCIDGVVTDDTDFFMSLKPADVSKIKVLNTQEKLQVFGALGKGGILLVETKIPDHAARVPRSKHSFTVQGLTEDVSLNNVNPFRVPSRTPDLRTNVLWAPQIATGKNGEALITFYTSDVTGDFDVQIDGLTSEGVPFAAEETIKIEFTRPSN